MPEQGKPKDNSNFFQSGDPTRPLLYGKSTIFLERPVQEVLGPISLREDIQSSDGPYPYLPEHQTVYSPNIIQALINLYAEYNSAFAPLVVANKEWSSDYQFATDSNGISNNRWVQIDMVGLPNNLLQIFSSLDSNKIAQLLKYRIFEFENNLACYQETMFMFSKPGEPSLFEREFRASLEQVRRQYGKPIALLATTEEKYVAMMQEELGKGPYDIVTDEEVLRLTGFDKLFSPAEFERYVNDNGGTCDFLLYVRSSDPVAKLRDPRITVENPLLAQENMRRIIKQNAFTFNVDNPTREGTNKTINDTKMYLSAMGIAFAVTDITQLDSEEFKDFLQRQGINPEWLYVERIYLRAKPALRSYGCYGQERGPIDDGDFRRNLRKGLNQRGPYIIQPEMQIPIIVDERGTQYAYMDRVYLTTDGQSYRFMGGCRYFMPIDSQEYRKGRIHGNSNAVLGEIVTR